MTRLLVALLALFPLAAQGAIFAPQEWTVSVSGTFEGSEVVTGPVYECANLSVVAEGVASGAIWAVLEVDKNGVVGAPITGQIESSTPYVNQEFVVPSAGFLVSTVSRTTQPSGAKLRFSCINASGVGGAGAGDGVDVLIGGQNSVADQANPNSPVIVCPQTNAACMYLSSTTGWWSAVSSDGESVTSWGSETEQVIYSYALLPSGSWDTFQTYDTANTCIRQRMQYFNNAIGACTANEMPLMWTRDVTITSISAAPKAAQNGTDGCDFKLVEALTGTDVANAELHFPASPGATIAAGEVVSATVGTRIDAGTRYALMYQGGTYCQTGTCNCGGGNDLITLEIRGIYH